MRNDIGRNCYRRGIQACCSRRAADRLTNPIAETCRRKPESYVDCRTVDTNFRYLTERFAQFLYLQAIENLLQSRIC